MTCSLHTTASLRQHARARPSYLKALNFMCHSEEATASVVARTFKNKTSAHCESLESPVANRSKERAVKHAALAINLMLVLCKTLALWHRQGEAISQSLCDSIGDVLGNVALVVLPDAWGVLLQALVMGLASMGVIVQSALALWMPQRSSSNLAVAAGDSEAAALFIAVAVLSKGLLFAICWLATRGSASFAGSGVQAIREDAANDVVMNSGAFLCAVPEMWLPVFHGSVNSSVATCLILKMDPAWAFLVSLPILHGWYKTARSSAASLNLYRRGLSCWDRLRCACLHMTEKITLLALQRIHSWAESLVGWQHMFEILFVIELVRVRYWPTLHMF